jgi:hypothetical protein
MAGITTRFRCAIGSHLSYPARLSTIEKALGSVLDRFDIEVRFWDYKAARPGEVREKHPVIEVEYNPTSPDIRTIRVNPVTKEISGSVREGIDLVLSEKVAPWLDAERSQAWGERYHALRIFFSGKNEFQIDEHNQA